MLLSPRTTLAGRTLADLLFRDHYGISVLAICRKGSAYRTALEISPHLLMMTVAISASSSFASPLSHPAHPLVMSPGG